MVDYWDIDERRRARAGVMDSITDMIAEQVGLDITGDPVQGTLEIYRNTPELFNFDMGDYDPLYNPSGPEYFGF